MLVFSLKSKILSILNMGLELFRVIWAFWSQWCNQFAIWSYDTKVMATSAVFYISTVSAFMEDGSMENVGGKSKSVQNKLASVKA
jgi:hypothetical protein